MKAVEYGLPGSYSGITANPTLGAATDRLVQTGCAAISSETSEIYGAEHLLIQRAVHREVGERLVARLP